MKRKGPLKKRIIYFVLWTGFVLFFVLPTVFLSLALEDQPAVSRVMAVNSDQAVGTRLFVKRTLENLLHQSHKALTISATADDLNGLFAFGHRSISRIFGKSYITPEGFVTFATLKMPPNPLGDFLNLEVHIAPSDTGLRFDAASVGRLSLSDRNMRFLTIGLLNMLVGFNEGKALYDAIGRVALSHDRIDLHLKPIPNMERHVLNVRKRLSIVRDEAALMGDPKKVRGYYAQIMKIAESIPKDAPISFSYYIGELFKIAELRGGDPVVENRAAILALGVYFGSWRVEQMIGPVRTDAMKRQGRKTNRVGLAKREDLRLHFIISAALEIASERGITHAIGEFKELLDAGDGGSGFSFVDLAADRAGVRFSEAATAPATAKRFQERLAENASEDQFFPKIDNLPEGLTKADFERYFGGVESERYVRLVNDVDACLAQLPLYRDVSGNNFTEKGSPGGCEVSHSLPADQFTFRQSR